MHFPLLLVQTPQATQAVRMFFLIYRSDSALFLLKGLMCFPNQSFSCIVFLASAPIAAPVIITIPNFYHCHTLYAQAIDLLREGDTSHVWA